MKKSSIILGLSALVFAAVVGWSVFAVPQEQRSEVFLRQGYVVGGVTLKAGKYVVIHRPVADHEGQACTFFYRAPYRNEKDAVAKVKCVPSEGTSVSDFTIKSTAQPDGTSLIRSIQFAGSTEIHTLSSGS